jgi:hypothetical protein
MIISASHPTLTLVPSHLCPHTCAADQEKRPTESFDLLLHLEFDPRSHKDHLSLDLGSVQSRIDLSSRALVTLVL